MELVKLANTLLKGKRRDGREGEGNLAPTVISKTKSQPLCIHAGPDQLTSYGAWPPLDPPVSISNLGVGLHASTSATGLLGH